VNTVEQIADEVLATLLESADDAVIVADASGAIRYWNPRCRAIRPERLHDLERRFAALES
jgi:PAS domain-containing protein